jgi:hypothetical protein
MSSLFSPRTPKHHNIKNSCSHTKNSKPFKKSGNRNVSLHRCFTTEDLVISGSLGVSILIRKLVKNWLPEVILVPPINAIMFFEIYLFSNFIENHVRGVSILEI